MSDAQIDLYSKGYKISRAWLAENIGGMTGGPARTVIVGKIGAGEHINPIDDHEPDAGLDEIELPPGAPHDAFAVLVEGNSQWPRYMDGEIVFYRRDGRAPSELIGQECVLKTPDGRMMLKIVRAGSKTGLFNLESWSAPTIEGCKIEWAAPVIRPRWR